MDKAPFYADVADGPDGAVAHWVRAADGVRLRLTHWPCAGAKGTVLIFTGRTEFCEKYGRPVRALQDAGYAVLAIDWRGQGLSDRLLAEQGMGHVGAFKDYQLDAAAMLDHARALALPEPFLMFAHSLGGGIGLRSLIEGFPVEAAVFSAPMWGIAAAPWRRAAILAVAGLAEIFGQSHRVVPGLSPKITIAQTPFGLNELTHDRDEYAHLQRQVETHPALGLGAPSLHWVRRAVEETDRLAALPSPNVPTLTLLGTQETIVTADRIHDRMRRWPRGELTEIEGGRHEMIAELPKIRAQFMAAVIAHYDAHT